ncbi:hypothetical protein L323_05035 [Ruminiclostridium papyrosolvens C7]|uniref:Uncharacterized protein n=1 Tax=Ruminiclostridium papyrosolvens C7 TaxID=1330534 RepID=U4R4I2_9FIRM|nr:hypothetical protein L323_05035 [Ruminiclostridium papyrosolvens C7]
MEQDIRFLKIGDKCISVLLQLDSPKALGPFLEERPSILAGAEFIGLYGL